MELLAKRFSLVDIRLNEKELMLINNALNEVCNGVDIADFEFATRLGANREEARALLDKINAACSASSITTTGLD